MAVGKHSWQGLNPISGIRLSSVSAGIKYSDRLDLTLIEICSGASVSAVFTQNAFCAEPVKLCRENLNSAEPTRFLVINSGNANACTGEPGMKAARATCEKVAELADVSASSVLPFSTGVIGEVLPSDKILAALPAALQSLEEDAWEGAANAILTTDTRPKGLTKVIGLAGEHVTISGISKGAGMINPNMGTMLAYIATDAQIDQAYLDRLVADAANKSFNRITVDGDTSTNDALVLMATGKSGGELEGENLQAVSDAIIEVCQFLALEIVKDAEGASKCVKVEVNGGAVAQESLDVAYAICHSPLVKTALFASDPNWGRIVAAIGYAGITDLDVSKISVYLDDVQIVDNGERAASYSEEAGQHVFDREEFTIRVELGRGACNESLWTSDLSHDYVRINAEYRT